MVKLRSFWLFILIDLWISTYSISYDPTQSLSYYFAANTTITDNYALFIMAQSSFEDNVFKFISQNIDFSNFLAAVEMKPITLPMTLVFTNTWTQQDADAISQDTSNCVYQTSYDCTTNSLVYDICSAVAPVPSQDSLVQISSQVVDCTTVGSTNSVCNLVLSNYDLTDLAGNVFFSFTDTLCPSSSIKFIVTIEAFSINTPIMSDIVGSGSVSFHFLSLMPAIQDQWLTAVSTSRFDNTSRISQTTNIEDYLDDSYLARSDIQTVIQTKLFQHDSSVDIYCQYQVTFTGLIRGIYINDYPSSNHMPREYDLDLQSIVQSTTSFQLRANHLNLITIVGYRLSDTILEFNNCQSMWDTGTTITTPNFSEFIFNPTLSSSEIYAIPSNGNSCPDDCEQCTYSGICIKCSTDYFLAYGICSELCPEPLYIPDYKGVCNTILESTTTILGSPQINNNEVIIDYFDDFASVNNQALILHSKNEISLNPAPIVWPDQLSLLPESVLVFLPTLASLGASQVTIPITNVADSSILSSYSPPSNSIDYPTDTVTSLANKVFAVYYPLNPNPNTFLGIYWYTSASPASLTQAQQKDPDSTFLLKNRRYQYISTYGFYIFQAFVSCIAECQIQVTCDGIVQLYKNDQVLLFDLDFQTHWTYQYSQTLTGSFHLKFIVKGANYFQPFVIGDDFQLSSPSNPTSVHAIGPLPVDQHTCNISNCLTCQDSICLSCQSGYFLSLDQSTCLGNCPGGDYYSTPEATCQSSCDISSQTINPTNNECLPTCDEPGYYFTPTKGCQVCVPECKTCYDATTCLECKVGSSLSNSTYCFRKAGTLFDLKDFTTTQTVSVLKDSDLDLVLVVADKSSFSNFTLFFHNPVRKIPRILKTIKMTSDSSNISHATISPLQISESGEITTHYFKIKQDNNPTNFSISAFLQTYSNDWPLEQAVQQIDILIGPIKYNTTVNDDEGLSKLEYQYPTLIASKIYEHSETSQIACKLQITYYGDLRGVYVNGKLILAHSTSGATQTIKSRPFTLEPQEMFLVSYVGFIVNFQNIVFTDCTKSDTNGNSVTVTPQFTSYLLEGKSADPDDFYAPNNTYCGQYCHACLNENTCLRCQVDYYLEDGSCVPRCSDPTHLQLFYGFCQTQEWTQGYRYYWNYYPSITTFSLWHFVVLEVDVQFLFILHPFTVTSTSHATYAFIPGSNPTMATGCYEVRNYAKTDNLQKYYPIVQSNVLSSTGSVDILVYTVKHNLVLFYYYNSLPTTLAQLLQAQDFEYILLDGQVVDLQDTNTYFWDFFVKCPSQCLLKLQGSGNIQITQNERTIIFDAYLTESLGEITLSRTFSGLNHLVIKVWNADKFGFNIQGSGFTVLTQGHLVTHSFISIISAEPFLATNCINGYKSQCFSCKTGYLLNAATGSCTNSCPTGTQGLLTERLCANITCNSTNNFVERDGYCVFNCTNAPGFYYTPESGCDNQCNETCATCSGPLESHCLSCTYPRLLQSNGTCLCPVGTQDGPAGTCESISWINITANTSNIFCSNITLTANIREDEQTAYNITFFWSLDSPQSGLKAYLVTQSAQSIAIPGAYLDNSQVENFTVYYVNAMNKKIQTWKTVTVSYSILPGLSFVNGNSQSIQNYIESSFLAQFDNIACSFDLSSLINPSWTVVSGTLSAVDLIYSSSAPLKMMISSCILAPYNSVTLKFRASLKNDANTYVEQTLTLQTLPEKFMIFIKTNTRNHPETSDLILDGIIMYYEKCSLTAPQLPTYTWLCENVTPSGSPCTDPNGLFNSPNTLGKLIVPRAYFKKGDEFFFTLKIEKNGITQYSNIIISIQGSSALIVQISCQTLDCLWYTPSKEYLLSGNVQTAVNGMPVNLSPAEIDQLNMTWSISNTAAAVPFAYFETSFKIFASDPQLPSNLDFLTIQLTVQNATFSGTSSLNLPINRPPIPGQFLASPSSGSSLSTQFVLTADQWQEIDVPVTYQFYYAFSSASTLTPLKSHFDSNPNLTTIFPSQLPNGGVVNLWLYVQDYFGAQTIATAQITVSSNSLSLQQAINSYNQLLLEAQQSGDPFNVIQVIAMIDKEIEQLENQLTQNAPSPACPSCAGHGHCTQTQARCVCNPGWAVVDCSVKESDVETLVSIKEDLLNELSNTYLAMLTNSTYSPEATNTVKDILYQVLEASVDDQHFNTNSSLILIQQIINKTLDVFNPATVLTSSEIKSLTEILSDMLSFSANYDCSGSTNFTKDLEVKTLQYIEKISNSSFGNLMTNQNATIIDTQNIDMYFQQLSICNLNNTVISTGSASPTATITVNADLSTESCSTSVNLEFYAFNDNLLNCSKDISTNNNKTIIGIEITDPKTGKNNSVNVSVTIDFGGDPSKCPHSCSLLPDHRCQCKDLSPFDVGNQILRMFQNSNIIYVKDLSSLLQFQFWKTISFWSIFAFTFWFLATIIIIKKKLRKYDVMNYVRQLDQISKRALIILSIKVSHPLAAIYTIPKYERLSKTARALVFYTRNLLLLSFSSIFSGPSRDESAYNYQAVQFEFDFNVYLILLPYFTVQPLLILIKRLMLEPKNAPSTKKSFCGKIFYCLRYRVNVWFIFVVIVVNFTVILIINANQTSVQRVAWSVNFLQSLMQDAVVTPLLYIIGQYVLFKAHSNTKFAQRYPKLHQKLPRLFNEFLPEIFAKLETTTLKKSKVQAVTNKIKLSDDESALGTPRTHNDRLLQNHTSPTKFSKPSRFISAGSLKESDSPLKSKICLQLDPPVHEIDEEKSSDITKILDLIDVRTSRPLKIQRNISELQDFQNTPTHSQTSSIKRIIPSPLEISKKSYIFSTARDLGESGFLLNQQTPRDEADTDLQFLSLTNRALHDPDKDIAFQETPSNIQLKIDSRFQPSHLLVEKRQIAKSSSRRTLKDALSPSAQNLEQEIDLQDLNKEPQLQVSPVPKKQRHTTFLKRESRRRIRQPGIAVSVEFDNHNLFGNGNSDTPKINIVNEEIKEVQTPTMGDLEFPEKSPGKGAYNFTDQLATLNLDN